MTPSLAEGLLLQGLLLPGRLTIPHDSLRTVGEKEEKSGNRERVQWTPTRKACLPVPLGGTIHK